MNFSISVFTARC